MTFVFLVSYSCDFVDRPNAESSIQEFTRNQTKEEIRLKSKTISLLSE
ncbi:MAG: hypothetical protein QOE96_1865 [Blastocatellia bacterium]|jgi:hypothetical protein|nr:hypothetical protein [Blastocatellia bacterium]